MHINRGPVDDLVSRENNRRLCRCMTVVWSIIAQYMYTRRSHPAPTQRYFYCKTVLFVINYNSSIKSLLTYTCILDIGIIQEMHQCSLKHFSQIVKFQKHTKRPSYNHHLLGFRRFLRMACIGVLKIFQHLLHGKSSKSWPARARPIK